jgi:hypothetical protein
MDSKRTGSLNRAEVLGAISVVLPVDRDKLEALIMPACSTESEISSGNIEEPSTVREDTSVKLEEELALTPSTTSCDSKVDLWRQWDRSGTGRITQAEFENPEGGLLVWILDNLKRVHRQTQPAPSLLEAKEPEALGEWFDFWDWGQLGFLTQCQVARAILKEFEDQAPWPQLGELVDRVWNRTTETSKEEECKSEMPTSPNSLSSARHVLAGAPGSNETESSCPSPSSSSMRSHGKLALDEAPSPVPDHMHLAAGICARADFVAGLGMHLRDELRVALSREQEERQRFDFGTTPAPLEESQKAKQEVQRGLPLDARLEAKRYWLQDVNTDTTASKDKFQGPRCQGLALVPHPGDPDTISVLSAFSTKSLENKISNL